MGSAPFRALNAISYDPANREMYIFCSGVDAALGNFVPCYGSSSSAAPDYAAIDAKNALVYRATGIAFGGFYDPANKEMLLELGHGAGAGDNLTALNTGNQFVTSFAIPTSSSYGFIHDPANHDVYVGNGKDVYVVSASNVNTLVAAGISCTPALFDPANKNVFCLGAIAVYVVSSS
jgi:DNA-binding beta-propeller fold protein YncE